MTNPVPLCLHCLGAKATTEADVKREGVRFKQWQKDSLILRDKAKVSPHFRPWTSRPSFTAKGVRLTDRVTDLMDSLVIDRMAQGKQTLTQIINSLDDTFLDFSQSHQRKCWTQCGINKCLTTSSTIYSYGADRLVLPIETLKFMGYPESLKLPYPMSHHDIRDFVGEAMCLPCVAAVLWSLVVNVPFDKADNDKDSELKWAGSIGIRRSDNMCCSWLSVAGFQVAWWLWLLIHRQTWCHRHSCSHSLFRNPWRHKSLVTSHNGLGPYLTFWWPRPWVHWQFLVLVFYFWIQIQISNSNST